MTRIFLALLLLGAATAGASAQTIVCFGDSLTAGKGSAPGEAFPDFLQKDLAAAGYHEKVVNQGIAGNTTKDGLERIDEVLAVHPSVVLLELGANDGLLQQPATVIEENLSTIIEKLQGAHVRVLLAGINMPRGLPNGPSDADVDQFNPIFPALAARYHVALVPSLLKGVYGVPGLMSSDYIHPNSIGYERVAHTVVPYLEPMLEKDK